MNGVFALSTKNRDCVGDRNGVGLVSKKGKEKP